jgi:hypothetical protein
VSEESSTGVPGTAPPEGEPVPPSAGRLRWLGRASLRVRIATVVVAAAVVAAVVFVAVPSSSPEPAYTSLPAPCAVVSATALARFLPDPTGTPLSTIPPNPGQEGSCKWSSTTGGDDRTLHSVVAIFGSPSGITKAQQTYNGAVSAFGCHCKGVAVRTQSVAGIGDQATAVFITPGPDAGYSAAPNASDPGVTLILRSGNAEMSLSYHAATATGTLLPTSAGELPWLISVARGILADLARPAIVSAAPVSAVPRYAGSRDPCRLITPATLAKYASGASLTPGIAPKASASPSGAQTSTCTWAAGGFFILLNLDVFPNALRAREGFDADAQSLSQSGSGTPVTGTRWLESLGEEAAALFQTRSSSHGVEILVWSGNIELDYWFGDTVVPAPANAALLAGGLAMARDGLAALASPSASSYRQRPVYASPRDACPLVRASTLARYAPGATIDRTFGLPSSPGQQVSNCAWDAQNGDLALTVTIYTGADGALGGYEFGVKFDSGSPGSVVEKVQPVNGLGDQATAILETSLREPQVDLDVVSGNAEIELSDTDLLFGPALSRVDLLAAEIAMIRDVLADLPR